LRSIRKYLLIYLFLTISITATTTSICNFYINQIDIHEHQDTLMAMSAISYQSLLGNDLEKRPLNEIQESINNIPKQISAHYPKSLFYSNLPNYYLDRFYFKVLNQNNELLLKSASKSVNESINNTLGFSDKIIENEKWRVFTTYNSQAKYHTILGEKYSTRLELGKRIAIDEFFILLFTFPIAGFFIWVIVSKGLKSLNIVAKTLSSREANNYEPLIYKNIPSEIKPVINELNMLLQRLKSGFERETRFAADAAHELKTPLAALKAQAQVALNTNNIEEKNIALNKVIAAADRTTRIVQQLLVLSKLSPEVNYNSKWQDIDLNIVCKEVLTLLAPLAIENKVELELLCESNPPLFSGNFISIGILLKNLVENAINYSGNNGKITVRTYQESGYIVLEVQDNGPGIPKEIQARVFERFYRALGNKKPGSGLGLAIVEEIVKIHNAKIKLTEPLQGSGLVVRVYFIPKTI
jgi:two-component system sensor histidine kinase QseC